ncbi:MAG: hypothetical protein ACRDKI_00565 [Solirubrobacterales bacterium]
MADEARKAFDQLTADYDGKPGVTTGKMMSADGLRIEGKIFAMFWHDSLVVKLPAAVAAGIVAGGGGQVFEPGPGRKMREWVVFEFEDDLELWRKMTADSFEYVVSLIK